MNENQKLVRAGLSFVLVLVLIIGTAFGINLPFDADDVMLEETEKVEVDMEAPVEDTVDNSSQDSAPVDEDVEDVDNSGEVEVTEPSEDDNTVTEEGDKENA